MFKIFGNCEIDLPYLSQIILIIRNFFDRKSRIFLKVRINFRT